MNTEILKNRKFLGKFLVLLLLFSFTDSYAKEPNWIHKPPQPLNYTYTFVTINADARSLNEGRKECLQMLSLDRGLLNTLTMTYKSEDKIVGEQQYKDGIFSEDLNEKSIEVITYEGKPIQLKAKIVDEYFNNNNLTTLYQVATIPNPYFDETYVTTKYGGHGVWRSAIVPGWGQLYKGSKLKGGLIMGGTVATIGGIIVTDCVRSDYVRKISKTKSVEIKRAYATKADHYAMGRNVCIGALAALYIYNIIDAAVAPGARRVVVKDRKDRRYSFLPSTTDDGGPALSAFMRF